MKKWMLTLTLGEMAKRYQVHPRVGRPYPPCNAWLVLLMWTRLSAAGEQRLLAHVPGAQAKLRAWLKPLSEELRHISA